MYRDHWGLRESPFRSCLDSGFFYRSPTHEEALARMLFLVEQRRRLGLLMGPRGSGKSLLLEVFAEQLRRAGSAVAQASLLGVDPVEMLTLLAFGLQLNPEESANTPVLWRAITDRLAEYGYQQRDTVLLLDDADRASQPVAAQLERLAQHDLSPRSRITIVLAGCREGIGCLGKRLLELAELRIDLESWDRSQTQSYLSASLAEAGRQSPVFDEPAVTRLHELSHGIPRRLNQLADLALLAGAGADKDRIDADTVESVCHELGVIEV